MKNSPIFSVDKVVTPILLMSNKNDRIVPFAQGVQLFSALRRLEKPSWMLQYDDGGHGVVSQGDRVDYSKRGFQFFEHYLKGSPPPKWMTQNRPPSFKGIDDFLSYDLEGSCSVQCKICREKRYDMNAVLNVMNSKKKPAVSLSTN